MVANVETLVSSSLVISNAASQRPATPATSIWGPDMAMHEPIETRRRAVPGSNRSFGRVFSCFLLGRFVAARGRKIRLAIGHSVLVCFFSWRAFRTTAAELAQSVMVLVPPSCGQSDRHVSHLSRGCCPGRPNFACQWKGSLAAEMGAGRQELLDPARATRTTAGYDVKAVLKERPCSHSFLSFGSSCVCGKSTGFFRSLR